jgi:SAM-dependent methyltransferase
VNRLHQWLCRSACWSRHAQRTLVPWVIGGVDLGADVLEIGPGYGVTTRILAQQVSTLTAIELDARLAECLARDLAGVRVVQGDGADMPLAADSYSGVVCFTMLHHVPSPELQDQLFAETFRVLAPGGVFAGSDNRSSLPLRLVHLFDNFVAVDPNTLPRRLAAAGFEQIRVDKRGGSVRFRGQKPRWRQA